MSGDRDRSDGTLAVAMSGTCSADGCDTKHYAKGWCYTHYDRVRRTGSPVLRSLADRLWEKVDKTDTCWLFTGSISNGYGKIWIDGERRQRYAHRLVYELLVGPIPTGLQIDHLCRVRRCVNPAHLEPVTHLENNRRGMKAMQTVCKRGHLFDEANTYYQRNGTRGCRTCHRERERARVARVRAAA